MLVQVVIVLCIVSVVGGGLQYVAAELWKEHGKRHKMAWFYYILSIVFVLGAILTMVLLGWGTGLQYL